MSEETSDNQSTPEQPAPSTRPDIIASWSSSRNIETSSSGNWTQTGTTDASSSWAQQNRTVPDSHNPTMPPVTVNASWAQPRNAVIIDQHSACMSPLSDSVSSLEPRPKRGRKSDKERMEAGIRREWDDGEILRLIELWELNDVLYDSNHPMYYVHAERKLAMDMISAELGIGLKDVHDKMHSLRTYFSSQKQKQDTAARKGWNNPSRWKFFDKLSFLKGQVQTRESRREEQMAASQIDLHVPPKYMPQIAADNCRVSSTAVYAYNTDRDVKPLLIRNHEGSNRMQQHMDAPQHIHPPVQYLPQTSPSPHPRQRHVSEASSADEYREVVMVEPPEIKASSSEHHPPQVHEASVVRYSRKTDDELFGDLVVNTLSKISDEQLKERVKIEVQTLLFNARFKGTVSSSLN